jgi:uncharacterized protein (TIGR03000 family)
MIRIIATSVLVLFGGVVGGRVSAAPPAGFTPGPNPIFGSPGPYNPGQFSYPAPGTYGSTTFAPFSVPPLSNSVTPYNVPVPPPEWPAVAAARVTIRLPSDAKLWVDGKPTKQTGPVREFVTPPVLRAGLTYQYTFRAEWTHDGQPVIRERPVAVRATGSTDVDFAKP